MNIREDRRVRYGFERLGFARFRSDPYLPAKSELSLREPVRQTSSRSLASRTHRDAMLKSMDRDDVLRRAYLRRRWHTPLPARDPDPRHGSGKSPSEFGVTADGLSGG